MKKITAIVLCIALLGGCSTKRLNIAHPEQITSEKLSQIKKGVTRKDEITSMFGRPHNTIVRKTGEEFWFYKDFNLYPLWVEFDSSGTVVDYTDDGVGDPSNPD